MQQNQIIKCSSCGNTSFILISMSKYRDKIAFTEDQMLVNFDPHVGVNVYDKTEVQCAKCGFPLNDEATKDIVYRIKNGEFDD